MTNNALQSDKKPSPVRSLYMSTDEKTFHYEDSLPALPVPELHQTLKKYLKCIKPFVSEEQYEQTRKTAEKFEKGIGKILQDKLKKRASRSKNWLYDWWQQYAYLTTREPLAPCMNMSGPQSLHLTIWKPNEEKALERVAMNLWATLDFFRNLREENLKPQKNSKGNHLSMHQFRYLFNTTRIPKEGMDEIACHFKLKTEGECPSHIVVLCYGHVWVLNPWYSPGEMLSIPEIEEQLKYIEKISEALGEGAGIGTLTFDHREMWAKNRKWLCSLSKQNEDNLLLIESAILVYSLDRNSPKDLNEVCQLGHYGDPVDRWADKSYCAVSFKNGYQVSGNDHTPFDAMVTVVLGHYQHEIITDEFGGTWNGPKNVRKIEMPRRLTFVLDELVEGSIERIKKLHRSLANNTVVLFREVNLFGKNWIKSQKLHPDAFVQCALQLGYFLHHGRLAPTYETATTRKFYKARTETIRSCTVEMAEFVKVMTTKTASVKEKKTKLLKAINNHLELTRECQNGEGIDRHLMGLNLIAAENGMPTPDLYKDPSYTLSGGNGNFILSTSTLGYANSTGGVSAMVKDGYGVFYVFLPDRDCIVFYITAYKNGNSDADAYMQSVIRSLIYMQEVVTDPQSQL